MSRPQDRAEYAETQASLLVLAKAIGLSGNYALHYGLAANVSPRCGMHEQSMPAFQRLKQSTAQQILEFHRMPARPVRKH